MNKNLKYVAFALALPVLTVVVWLIWVFIIPAIKDRFLYVVSSHTEKLIYGEPKRKTKGLRKAAAKKNKR